VYRKESGDHVIPASLSVRKTPCLPPYQRQSLSDTQINLFTGDEPTLNRAPRGPLSKAEREKQFKENRCFYCGKVGHRATNCFLKKGKTTKPYDPKARAVKTEDKKPEEDASPAYDTQTQVSRFYSNINNYDILCPKSAPVNEDF
jgi:hypothetical protein